MRCKEKFAAINKLVAKTNDCLDAMLARVSLSPRNFGSAKSVSWDRGHGESFSVEGKFRGGVRSPKNGARIEWTQDGQAGLETIREIKLLRRSKKAYSLVWEKVRRNVGVVWMIDYMKWSVRERSLLFGSSPGSLFARIVNSEKISQ